MELLYGLSPSSPGYKPGPSNIYGSAAKNGGLCQYRAGYCEVRAHRVSINTYRPVVPPGLAPRPSANRARKRYKLFMLLYNTGPWKESAGDRICAGRIGFLKTECLHCITPAWSARRVLPPQSPLKRPPILSGRCILVPSTCR